MNKLGRTLICGSLLWFSPSFIIAKETEKIDLDISFRSRPEISVNFDAVQTESALKSAVVLSDGSRWVIRNDKNGAESSQIALQWRFGDEVRIGTRDPGKLKGHYILKNMRNGKVCLADLDFIPEESEGIYFIEMIDKNGYAIRTQDGSEWAIGWYGSFTTRSWRAGDRLIINKSSHSNAEDYLIINIDHSEDVWASHIKWTKE